MVPFWLGNVDVRFPRFPLTQIAGNGLCLRARGRSGSRRTHFGATSAACAFCAYKCRRRSQIALLRGAFGAIRVTFLDGPAAWTDNG
jgi:hypothetical protein